MADVRLIDANELIDRLTKYTGFRGNCEDCTDIDCVDCIIENAIKNAPTVDAVPVVHGRWERFETIIGNIGVLCSICGWKDYHHGRFKRNLFPYCPNCGAKMDGDGSG